MGSPVVTWSNLAAPFWMNAKFTPSPSAGVAGGPVPTAKVLQGGIIGTAYSETISAQGGSSPYTFSVASGALPAGLSLNGSTGVVLGTPTTVQTADFTVQATDANGATGSTDFEITIVASGGSGAPANYCIIQ